MHHAHSHFARHDGADSLHFELPHRTRAFGFGDIVDGIKDVGKDVAGVGKGIVEGAVDTVTGIATAVTHPVETVTGISKLITDPKEAWPAVWHGITDPIVEDWQNGNPGEAIGRGGWTIFEAVFGAKGLTKIGKAGTAAKHADDLPTAPRPVPVPKPDIDAPKPDAPKPDAPKPDAPKHDPANPTGPVHDARTSAALLKLEESGVKFSKDAIRFAEELPEGSKIKSSSGTAFLETGNDGAGLKHILDGNPAKGTTGHRQDFINRGVPEEKIPDLLREAVAKGDVTPVPGKKGSYDIVVQFEGAEQKLRMGVGSNGFIVSAFPV